VIFINVAISSHFSYVCGFIMHYIFSVILLSSEKFMIRLQCLIGAHKFPS